MPKTIRLIVGFALAVVFLGGSLGVLAGLTLAVAGASAAVDQCPSGNDCHDARMAVILGVTFLLLGFAVVWAVCVFDRKTDVR